MTLKQRWQAWTASEPARWMGLGFGILFLAITPIIGPLPGPGGIVTFAIGAGLVLRNSRWAKRWYARFKKRHPNKGRWADWSLRRESAKRRESLAKERRGGD